MKGRRYVLQSGPVTIELVVKFKGQEPPIWARSVERAHAAEKVLELPFKGLGETTWSVVHREAL